MSPFSSAALDRAPDRRLRPAGGTARAPQTRGEHSVAFFFKFKKDDATRLLPRETMALSSLRNTVLTHALFYHEFFFFSIHLHFKIQGRGDGRARRARVARFSGAIFDTNFKTKSTSVSFTKQSLSLSLPCSQAQVGLRPQRQAGARPAAWGFFEKDFSSLHFVSAFIARSGIARDPHFVF